MKNRLSGWRQDLAAAGMIAGFYALLMVFGITCPIQFITGISCPGCGMTRAWLRLLRLDIAGAARYHALFWLPVPAAGLYLGRRRLPAWAVRLGFSAVAAAFLLVWLARMLSGTDPVVTWAPENGLALRLLRALLKELS